MAVAEPSSTLAAKTLSGGRPVVGLLVRKLLEAFEALPRWAILGLALASLLLLALGDYLLDNELRLQVFYWAPIALAAWFAGRRWGLLAVLLASCLWLVAHWQLYLDAAQQTFLAWNFLVNLFSFAALGFLVAKLKELVEHQRDLALTDFVTGVPNARAFSELLQAEIQRGARSNRPLSMAYLDLDDFKRVNDTLGHDVGNDLLHLVANTVRARLRASDVVARLGGDEFAILLPDAPAEAAAAIMQRVLEHLDALPEARSGFVSVSIGLISCTRCPSSHEALLRAADALMYEVKAAGKHGMRHTRIDTLGADSLPASDVG